MGLVNLNKCYGLVLLIAAYLTAMPSHADTITLGFGTLPSAQGWEYLTSGTVAAETDVFSISGASLIQDTLGVGLTGSGINLYRRFSTADTTAPFSLSVRARLDGHEGSNVEDAFTFSVLVAGTDLWILEIGDDLARLSGTTPVDKPVDGSFMTDVFHDYRIEGQAGGAASLFVDDILIGSTVATPVGPGPFSTRLQFGDGTGGANARGIVTNYEFRQEVPEPSALALFILGIVGLGWMRRNRPPHLSR